MAYDNALAERIRKQLGRRPGMIEKSMFGGIGFLMHGNLCCGVYRNEMIVRIKPETTADAVRARYVRIFNITGRPMKGWVLVAAGGVATDEALAKWVHTGLSYTATLPRKG